MARAKGTGSIFKPKGSSYWWVAYVSGGKRRYESTKSTRKQDAQNLLTDRLGAVQKGIAITPRVGRITIGEALKAVVNDLTMNGRKAVAHTERRIHKHIIFRPATPDEPGKGYFIPDRRLSTVTTTDLTAYATHRLTQGASAASVNHELATIKRAFRLALRAGEIVTMPYIPMLQLHNVRQGFFERDQFEAVRDALPEALRGIVTFCYLTGWRVRSEVLSLRWAQVDRNAKTVRLEPGETKNAEGRTLPYDLLPELVDVIEQQSRERERLKASGVLCPYVFHREGKPIRDFRGAWEAACEAAGCPNKIPHDFRRTAVRNLVRAGVPEKTAMVISGHKTRSVFDRYDIVNESDLRAAFGKLDTWTSELQMKAEADKSKGQVQRFEKRAVGSTKS